MIGIEVEVEIAVDAGTSDSVVIRKLFFLIRGRAPLRLHPGRWCWRGRARSGRARCGGAQRILPSFSDDASKLHFLHRSLPKTLGGRFDKLRDGGTAAPAHDCPDDEHSSKHGSHDDHEEEDASSNAAGNSKGDGDSFSIVAAARFNLVAASRCARTWSWSHRCARTWSWSHGGGLFDGAQIEFGDTALCVVP